MDPNETLRLLRLTIKQMAVDTDPDIRAAHADEIAEYFEALDGWMSTGGFLPKAWRPYRAPLDIPPAEREEALRRAAKAAERDVLGDPS